MIFKLLRRSVLVLAILVSYSATAQSSLRIVSLTPSLTNMLNLLEVSASVVGCTGFCELPQGHSPRVIATAINVNVESVLALEPHLVVATPLTQQSALDKLRSLGINVRVFQNPLSFAGINEQFLQLAALVNKESLGKKIVEEQGRRMDKILSKVKPNTKPKIFFQLGSKPLFAVIPGTFMDDYITLAGGTNIAHGLRGGTISRETVIARNPDVILVVTMGVAANDEIENWKKFKNLEAVRNKKIFVIDADKACSPNPVYFVDILQEIIDLIYS